MPIWLSNYILYNMEFPDKYGYKTTKRNPKTASKEYTGLRGAKYKDRGRDLESTIAIHILLDELGIDLSRAIFHEVTPIPKLNGPMFSDPSKLCISYLKSKYNETIWITGRSSPHERFLLNDGKLVTLQGINNKQYQSVCQGFCWLDLNDQNNFSKNIKDRRSDNKIGLPDERNRKKGKEAEEKAKQGSRSDFDKSGYKKIPLVQKYADELAKIKQTKLAEEITEARENLIQLRDDIKSVLDIVFEDSADRRLANKIYNATSDFDDAMSNLYKSIDVVDEISRTTPVGSTLTKKVNEVESNLNSCKIKIRWAYNNIKPYLPATLDSNEIEMTDDDWTGF